MLAIRAIEEEYLGLDIEGADHRRYFDITPLILVVGVIFVIMRFIGLGTNDQALYPTFRTLTVTHQQKAT
jgi:hypothetical protein